MKTVKSFRGFYHLKQFDPVSTHLAHWVQRQGKAR